MPRKPNKDKWTSSHYGFGFCFNKDDKVYTNINGERKSTGLVWRRENKAAGVDILETRIAEFIERRETPEQAKQVATWYQLLKAYALARTNAAPETKRKLNNAISALLPDDFLLNDIDNIREILNKNIELRIKGKKSRILRNSSINKYLELLRQIFRYAVEEGFMKKQPIRKEFNLKEVSDLNRSGFSEEEIERLLGYLKENQLQFYYLVKFLAITGMRISECLSIMISDISQEAIKIRGKGGAIRYFPLESFPELIEIINEVKKENNGKYLFLWRTRGGASHIFNRSLKIVGIYAPYRSFHSLRKYMENKLVNAGVSTFIAAQLVGHSSRTQARHYHDHLQIKELNAHLKSKVSSKID